jgi:hypothetical protein
MTKIPDPNKEIKLIPQTEQLNQTTKPNKQTKQTNQTNKPTIVEAPRAQV